VFEKVCSINFILKILFKKYYFVNSVPTILFWKSCSKRSFVKFVLEDFENRFQKQRLQKIKDKMVVLKIWDVHLEITGRQ